LLNFVLQHIDPIVRRYDTSGERGVALHQGFGGAGDLLVVEATHVRNLSCKLLQVCVKRPGGMFDHDDISRSNAALWSR
jgi:hypothetical protein